MFPGADKAAPPKQRHTAKRIFERLRIEHGFAGGYTVVKDYVRAARVRAREMFVPSPIRRDIPPLAIPTGSACRNLWLAPPRPISANASALSAACG